MGPRKPPPEHTAALELPALDAPLDDGAGDVPWLDDGAFEVTLPDSAGDDPFDDSYASDIPLDFELQGVVETGTAIGDDNLGLDDHEAPQVPLSDSRGSSFLDDGSDEPLFLEGDDELGIDPIPREQDDGGLEGLEDPSAKMIDQHAFPPLGGEEDDNDELDIGVQLPELRDISR